VGAAKNMFVFDNVLIFDGTGRPSFEGSVVVEGNRIAEVFRGPAVGIAECAKRLDARGATLLPGLIESHAHLSFGSTVECLLPFGPHSPELRLLRSAMAARVMLDYGYTSCYSGGSLNAAGEVALRNEIAAGRLSGPRIRACSFERAAENASVVARPGTTRTYSGIA
jgi:imidazolonepropionase-like amidohydrolase